MHSDTLELFLCGFALGSVFAATGAAMYVVAGTLFRPRLGTGPRRDALSVGARLALAVALLPVMALYGPALKADPSSVIVAVAALTTTFVLPGLLIMRRLFRLQITYEDVLRDIREDS